MVNWLRDYVLDIYTWWELVIVLGALVIGVALGVLLSMWVIF